MKTEKARIMDDESLHYLEKELQMLSMDLGARFCLIPRTTNDLCYLAIYDDKGEPVVQVTAIDLRTCVNEAFKKRLS